MSDKGLTFSQFIQGYWRLAEWDMTREQWYRVWVAAKGHGVA